MGVVPDLVEKKKQKKNKKRKADEVGNDTLVKADVENDTPEGESKPKKKKKNKTKESGEGEVEEEEDNFDVDSGVFKKKFYTPDETTQAMTKAEMKSYQAKEHITLYGKGRKTMKPLLEFKSLGFPANIMSVCKKFEKPTPIQAQCWPVLASGRM